VLPTNGYETNGNQWLFRVLSVLVTGEELTCFVSTSLLEHGCLNWVDCDGFLIINYWKCIANEQAGYPAH
jgi:hypothetical protein